ncbi:MAG: ethanolamine ammonia-lyase light chain [Candidatus Melainabacteria bacterium]|nr:MAG: ethanolamine ammonia-lyase light chain [Candidatus Melainabacteria bacterium]
MSAESKASNHSASDFSSKTPARVAVGRAGTRPKTSAWLKFRVDHALARDAISSELDADFIQEFAVANGYPIVQSSVASKDEFIQYPPRGKVVEEKTLAQLRTLCSPGNDVQIVISDGLSAKAVEKNAANLLPMIVDGLKMNNISCGLPVVVRYGRVAVGDQIAFALTSQVVINLIGERPGLSCAEGLSAYITYNPSPRTISSDRTVVSNIHERGTPAVEAGAYIVRLVKTILERKVSGVELQKLS